MDGKDKKKKGGSGFQVGKKKLKTELTPLAKAKAAQAMEVDKWDYAVIWSGVMYDQSKSSVD